MADDPKVKRKKYTSRNVNPDDPEYTNDPAFDTEDDSGWKLNTNPSEEKPKLSGTSKQGYFPSKEEIAKKRATQDADNAEIMRQRQSRGVTNPKNEQKSKEGYYPSNKDIQAQQDQQLKGGTNEFGWGANTNPPETKEGTVDKKRLRIAPPNEVHKKRVQVQTRTARHQDDDDENPMQYLSRGRTPKRPDPREDTKKYGDPYDEASTTLAWNKHQQSIKHLNPKRRDEESAKFAEKQRIRRGR